MSDQDDQEAGTFALRGKAVGFRYTNRTVMAEVSLVVILQLPATATLKKAITFPDGVLVEG